jgi:hypothetical protein
MYNKITTNMWNYASILIYYNAGKGVEFTYIAFGEFAFYKTKLTSTRLLNLYAL